TLEVDVVGRDVHRLTHGAVALDARLDRLRRVHADAHALEVQHDVGHVLDDARDRGELVEHALDLHGRDGGALEARQEDAADRIADRDSESALQRTDHELAVGLVRLRVAFEAARLDECTPVVGDHVLHVCSHTVVLPGARGLYTVWKRDDRPMDGRPDENGSVYTRRRFGGRQPLCGIGVTSLMTVIRRPALAIARSADSRPAPGPLMKMPTAFMPCSIAFFAASSATSCAANGVDLRDPLKPRTPALDHATVLPAGSVIVTI